MLARRAALAVLVTALGVAGCGGDDAGGSADGVDSAGLRDCLGESGAQVLGAAPPASGALGSVSADLHARVEGVNVEFAIEGSEARARRAAADLRGALDSFGVPKPERRLLQGANVVAVFQQDPTPAVRETVAACLE